MTVENQAAGAPAAPAPAPGPAPAPAPVPAAPAPVAVVPEIGAPAPAPAPAGNEPAPQPTGDRGLDMALTFFHKAGITEASTAMQAVAEKGDFSLLKAELSKTNAPGWEAHLELAQQAYERNQSSAKAKAEATKAIVVEVAGSEENWKAISEWAKGQATPEERDNLNGMIRQGGLQAKLAIQYLTEAHRLGTGGKQNTPQSKSPVKEDAARAASVNAGPLSPAEFQAAVRDLTVKVGPARVQTHPDYKQLRVRRSQWRG